MIISDLIPTGSYNDHDPINTMYPAKPQDVCAQKSTAFDDTPTHEYFETHHKFKVISYRQVHYARQYYLKKGVRQNLHTISHSNC